MSRAPEILIISEMLITNPATKKRIIEFEDRDHGEVADKYYELLNEKELDAETAKEMLSLIKEDPEFWFTKF